MLCVCARWISSRLDLSPPAGPGLLVPPACQSRASCGCKTGGMDAALLFVFLAVQVMVEDPYSAHLRGERGGHVGGATGAHCRPCGWSEARAMSASPSAMRSHRPDMDTPMLQYMNTHTLPLIVVFHPRTSVSLYRGPTRSRARRGRAAGRPPCARRRSAAPRAPRPSRPWPRRPRPRAAAPRWRPAGCPRTSR
jgi:hypothetical protein